MLILYSIIIQEGDVFMSDNIPEARLNWFTNDVDFPFFIQYGKHDKDLYIHSHKDFNELVIVIDGSAVLW